MNRVLRAAGMGLTLCLLLSMCGFWGNCEDIRGRVLRLHLLANSDDAADQAVKLKVRDAMTEAAAGLFDEVASAKAAAEIAEQSIPALAAVAERTLRENGMDYTATVAVTDRYFTTRTYDTVTLPAGIYRAVEVTLGEGKGHNWWCVVYPPLCLSAATDPKSVSDVLTDRETAIVTEKGRYRVKFKVVEWVKNAARFFQKSSSKKG